MILVIDGNSILNRAFYGIRLLTTRDGTPTNAVYGFINILDSVRAELKPDGVAVAFDLPIPTFRHKMYDGYKAGRKPMPQELAAQLEPAKQVLDAIGCEILSCPGYEADDILGTVAATCEKLGEACVILTGDRDSLQLTGANTRVRIAHTSMGKTEAVLYDEEKIMQTYGVPSAALVDVKALMGDSSDNIPGVAGVGEKTACALIAKFGSLDGVYENISDPTIKDGLRTKLVADRENAYLSKKLGLIDRAVPMEIDVSGIKNKKQNSAELRSLFVGLEFFKLLKKYGLEGASAAETAAPAAAPTASLEAAEPEKVFAAQGRLYALPEADGRRIIAKGGLCAEVNADSKDLFKALCSDGDKALYDLKNAHKALRKKGGGISGNCFDPMLAAYLVNPLASGYALSRLYEEYAAAPGEDVCEQAAAFVALCEALEVKVDGMGMKALLLEIEQPLAVVLGDMELRGICVDAEGLASFGTELGQRADAVRTEIYMLTGEDFNINSPKQLGEVLFEKLGIKGGKKTKTGYSTDAETLSEIADEHPAVELVLEYRKLTKLFSTYCEGLAKQIEPDGRIRTTFVQTETRTGRISSVEPNLQNIPVRTELGSRLRAFFVAAPGKVLLDADYSQIELRVLAAVAGDENMQRAFTEGKDIHTATAAQVFGLPQSMITPSLRSRAKAVNFGIVYGIGAFSLAKDIGVSVREADDYIKSYLAAYPAIAAYLKKTVEDAKKDGYVTTAYGRRRPLPELSSSNANLRNFGERAAKNTAIQGTAADIIKLAMIRVENELEKSGLGAKLLLQVHDELIVEAPLAAADACSEIIQREMESAAKLAVKLTAEVSRGGNWLEAKA